MQKKSVKRINLTNS